MNKFKLLVLFILAAVVFFSVSCGYGVHEGDNWRVTLHKARYEEGFGIAPNKHDGLVIDLSVEYIGPDGEVPAPAIHLKKGSEPEVRATLVQTNKKDKATDLIIRSWLGDTGTKFDMKKGDTISNAPISLLWSVPEKEKGGNFQLMVGDAPPIGIYL